jgi:TetR/AcrR family transcriptional regulator, regulator of cefoperazone and chloramphenicol sensitivity
MARNRRSSAEDPADRPDHSDRNVARGALIDAAIDLFGSHGFDAVSTRMLSDRAGTNLAAIKYHFGSKDALYLATVMHVVEQLQPRIALAHAVFDQGRVLAADDPSLQARLVAALVDGLLDTFLRNSTVRRFIPLVLREFCVPSQHFDSFYESLPRRLHELTAGVIALVERVPADDPRTIIRAHALIGQMMVFNLAREILFRRLGWNDYGDDEFSAVSAEVRRQVLRSLNLPEDCA